MTLATHEFANPDDLMPQVVLGAGRQMRCRHVVLPSGGALPLSGHFHRTITLVVAQGGAMVQRGGEVCFLHQEDSILIAPTTCYAVRNPGKMDLHLAVIETGAYLEADDQMPLNVVSSAA